MGEQVAVYSFRDFENIYDKYAGAFYHLILSMVQDAGAAAEILENSFCYVYKNIHQHDPSKCILFTWINNVVKLQVIIYAEKTQQKY